MNKQKGAIGVLLIVAVLLVGSGVYLAARNESSDTRNEQMNEVTDSSEKNDTNTESKKSVQVLTDAEIKSAVYPLSANFEGTKTSQINVTFPPDADNANRLTGVVYIDRSGSLLKSVTAGAEGFWISSYKYSDNSKTEAIVNVRGNFGGSGNDDRVFTVSKIDGEVIVKEI